MYQIRFIQALVFSIICLQFFWGENVYSQDIKETTEAIFYRTFGDDIEFNLQKYTLPKELKTEIEKIAEQKFFGDFIYIYKITKSDTTIAFGFLDNVYGKSLPITFLVILDKKGSIVSTDILKYREPYGGAVKDRNWNNQFSGLNSDSDYKVGKNIISISGATISVNSVTKGIRKITILYEKIQGEL